MSQVLARRLHSLERALVRFALTEPGAVFPDRLLRPVGASVWDPPPVLPVPADDDLAPASDPIAPAEPDGGDP